MGLQIFFAVIFIIVVLVVRRMRNSWDVDSEEYIPTEPYNYDIEKNSDEDDYDFTKVEGEGIDNIPVTSATPSFYSPELLAKYENIDSQYVPIEVMDEEEVPQPEPHQCLKDFSLQKAIIYSEIIKPKYINY